MDNFVEKNRLSLMHSAAVGAGIGTLFGATIGFYRGIPGFAPAVMGGGIGALTIGSYLHTWQFLMLRGGVDHPANHVIAGSVSGLVVSIALAGPRAARLCILSGGTTGLGIFFTFYAIEKWRIQKGLELALEKSTQRSSPTGLLIRTEPAKNVPEESDEDPGWSKWLPVRKISKQEAEELRKERLRVQEIRYYQVLP
jgi:hypothetical protein